MSKNITEFSPRQKIWLSALAALALPFVIAICGVGEIYLNNSDEFLFVLSDFWFLSIDIGAVIFISLFLLLCFLKGKAFHVAFSLL